MGFFDFVFDFICQIVLQLIACLLSAAFVAHWSQRRRTNDQLNVGRQGDNRIRIAVQESRLAPNIGLEESY